ncbi:hypothetical protein [Paenibacillus popilliae]|uniref:hypothetical protein n=1 Tax=Paenibacillus popilliae TaxID=78057 RepID=UPI0005A86E01|nr:hypothetical protein [Paenibacillus popilliae]
MSEMIRNHGQQNQNTSRERSECIPDYHRFMGVAVSQHQQGRPFKRASTGQLLIPIVNGL